MKIIGKYVMKVYDDGSVVLEESPIDEEDVIVCVKAETKVAESWFKYNL